jgi:diketogulonate reductase-like aldo/keto reductase
MFGRRKFLGAAAGLAIAALGDSCSASNAEGSAPSRSARPVIPRIGMGSWRTFDVGNDAAAIDRCTEILRRFFAGGGRFIDSSPMYGSSQAVIGECLRRLAQPDFFGADKVWTSGRNSGTSQIAATVHRWQLDRLHLLQVHNLVDWQTQLQTLFAMKAAGQVSYVGITSYDGIAYDDIESIMRIEPVDFVQLSYNIADRRAESRILPLARELGISVVANRPFQEGLLFQTTALRQLPAIAREISVESWAAFMLKYIISHPDISVAIPATSNPVHMRENMMALVGPMPDMAMREKMRESFG